MTWIIGLFVEFIGVGADGVTAKAPGVELVLLSTASESLRATQVSGCFPWILECRVLAIASSERCVA